MPIPKRVRDRIHATLKQFRTVLIQQRARDVSEADTATIVKDTLSDVFGYDKYAEPTSEHSVRSTFCDLAVKIDNKLAFLIEVKAIGVELKDTHVKQAVDYASNQGCEWVVPTNGINRHLYHVLFKKPIDKQEVAHFNLSTASAKSDADLERVYLLTREGFTKSALAEYRDRKDATSRFMLAAIILNSDPVQSAIRREIRRVSEHLVDEETIVKMLREEVIKRETIEGPDAETAVRKVMRSAEKRIAKASGKEDTAAPAVSVENAAS
jgi:predicted type IV restriction endonuclease